MSGGILLPSRHFEQADVAAGDISPLHSVAGAVSDSLYVVKTFSEAKVWMSRSTFLMGFESAPEDSKQEWCSKSPHGADSDRAAEPNRVGNAAIWLHPDRSCAIS